jgi:hypothetical protein
VCLVETSAPESLLRRGSWQPGGREPPVPDSDDILNCRLREIDQISRIRDVLYLLAMCTFRRLLAQK